MANRKEMDKIFQLFLENKQEEAKAALRTWVQESSKAYQDKIIRESIEEDEHENGAEEFYDSEDLEDIQQVSDDPEVIKKQFADLKGDVDRLSQEFDEIFDKTLEESYEGEKVKELVNRDGLESNRKFAKVNKESPVRGGKLSKSRPSETKSSSANGFSREAAPKSKEASYAKSARNALKAPQKVSKSSKATIAKPFPKGNEKSPLSK